MPPTTRKRTAALAEPSASVSASADINSSVSAKRQKKMPTRSKKDKAAALSGPEEEEPSTPAADNVVRFDDEGNADKELVVPAGTSTAPALAVTSEEAEGSGSDSDEAPEAVSTSRVAKKMMESAQVVKKLAQEQAAATKKKRQQRDALFKKQALERKSTNPADEGSLLTNAGRKRADRVHIPDVLPVEFLTDSSSDDEGDASPRSSGVVAARGARTVPSVERRLALEGRGPRDEVIGTTIYRVSRDVDVRMAPKAKKQSQMSKNGLLKRGRQPVKAKSSGFFKKS
ncbi:hypothetical protein E4U54_001413 [Claviceps lovelessii]|nr:hypothetical protein E4U54_001413 [Claviceps lovelessii]